MTDAVAPRLVSSTHEPVAAVSPGIRRYVRVLLENWGLHAEIIEDALVVVSEFVANVVDHAHTRFALVIQFSSQVLRIVFTTSLMPIPCSSRLIRTPSAAECCSSSRACPQQWGYDHYDGGKTVWADRAT